MKRLLVLFLLITLFACEENQKQPKEKKFHKILIGSEEFKLPQGFDFKEYYTGHVIEEISDSTSIEPKLLKDTIKTSEAGDYYLQVLGATSNYNGDHFRQIDVKVTPLNKQSEQKTQELSIMIDQQRATKWHHNKGKSIKMLAGELYEISFFVLPEESSRLYLDQVLLVNEADYQPKGYEYEDDSQEIVLPPAWAFGVMYGSYADQNNSTAIVTKLVKEKFPIDAFWTDSWFWNHYNKGDGPDGYLNFVGDTSAFYDMEAMWSDMERNNIKSGIWVWDAIQSNGNEQSFEEFLNKGFFREEPQENTDGWHNRVKNTKIGNVDFSNPEAVQVWKSKLAPFFEKGLDFFKLDRSSSIDFLKANYELTQEYASVENGRGLVMSHLHTTFDPKAKIYPIKWSGDAKIAWNQADYPNMGNYSMGGLKQNIQMIADPNRTTYENIFMANDIGGYNYFGSPDFGDELYIRWAQFGLLAPVSTVFSTADNPSGNLPFNFSDSAQNIFRYYANFKQALFPFMYTYAHQAVRTGEKIRRGDGKNDTQYLMGEELLIAPVYVNNARSREVDFPKGEWISFYDEKKVYSQGMFSVAAPLHQIPLFVKKGSIIPMRKQAINILSGHNDTIEWHIYPAKTGAFSLIEDDGLSTDYKKQQIATTKLSYEFAEESQLTARIHPTEGDFQGMKKRRLNQLFIHYEKAPNSVTHNGKEVQFQLQEENNGQLIIIELPESLKKEDQIVNVNF